MKKILFTQDIGVARTMISQSIERLGFKVDWSLADGLEIRNPEQVIGIVTASKPLTKELLGAFKNLSLIAMSFTGYDHVDKQYCLNNGIKVYNVPAYSTNSVCELAIGLAISLLRQIPNGDSEVRKGNWNESMNGLELAGKKCGIIGTGTIGCRLAEILHVFNCPLAGWSRTEKQTFINFGGQYLKLDDLFKESDIIFITIALNEDTRNLITKEQFKIMQKSAFLINVARGPIVKRDDLIDAINTQAISGVALDVYDYEPLAKEDELRSLKNSVLTPHIAYRTIEALNRKAKITIDNIEQGFKGSIVNRVI